MDNQDARKYRALTARANYLAQDRPDVRFAVKDMCRWMARPRKKDWRKLVRLAKYLAAHPRLIIRYDKENGVICHLFRFSPEAANCDPSGSCIYNLYTLINISVSLISSLNYIIARNCKEHNLIIVKLL